MPVNIHGKQYVTVAERLTEARDEILSINTEVVPNGGSVIIKATVTLMGGRTFTGISSANTSKAIEKASPYEVAETSAVGRALGFAGYGAAESIASADEIVKAQDEDPQFLNEIEEDTQEKKCICPQCGEPAEVRSGVSSKGKAWTGLFCSVDKTHVKWG